MSPELLSALIAALVGGAVGSAITAWASVAIARSQRREEAAAALWAYHYALSAFSAKEHSEWIDFVSLTEADFKQVRQTLQAAYPYAGYVGPKARRKLFRATWIEPDDSHGADPNLAMAAAKQFDDLADLLEAELDWAFPRRAGDRIRSLTRQASLRREAKRKAAFTVKKRTQREKQS